MSVASFSAHAESYLDKIKANGVIKVGIIIDFPPYGTTDVHNKPDGYDADVAKLLAQHLGVKLDLVPVTGPNRIPYLLTDKVDRSEEHTSELQSLMRISYAVFCLKKKKKQTKKQNTDIAMQRSTDIITHLNNQIV